MDKRGVELSMNVIIIAAIALIVLVVLVLLITGSFNNIQGGTSCQSLHPGGGCQSVDLSTGQTCASVTGNNNMISGGKTNCATGELCCYAPFQ
jgi:hypothetical protein